MIEEERLKQLVEEKAKIYYFDRENDEEWGVVEVNTKNFHYSYNEGCYLNFNEETWRTKPEPYKMYNDALYETRKEAEWVEKIHTLRVEYFDPPVKLEIFENYKITSKKGAKMQIYRRSEDEWWVWLVATYIRCDTYEEAVELARKYFLGKK